MPFAVKVKSLRETKGLSVRAAAKELGCSFGTIAKIESALSFPGQELLERMAALYGVPRLELEAEQAVDRGRIDVPAGVSADDIRAAVYRLAGQASPETQPVDPQGYECPGCGEKLRCVKG